VCGPRQVGKSTMLEHIAEPNRKYVSLRNSKDLRLAAEDPSLFFEKYNAPLLIDEFQLAPEILSTIQYLVDERQRLGEDSSGMFWLTGSQKFAMMENVGETLVGRCALYDMSSLSTAELEGKNVGWFDPDIEKLKVRAKAFESKTSDEIFQRIFRGGMPRLCADPELNREKYYEDYTNMYLMRDVRELAQIDKTEKFHDFIIYMAACTGQELNYATIAKKIQVSEPTVKKWVNVLDILGVICIIRPYYTNRIKRLVKTPKFYFMDTGLAAYLSDLQSPGEIKDGDMAGALFETYVVSEIVKSYYNAKKGFNLYYYRDTDKKEVDLLAVQGKKLYPIEIKLNYSPAHADKNLAVLDGYEMDVQPAVIICLSDVMMPYGEKAWLYPVSAL
ncbi:MAG: DUF4143 domain-containing protein, partial [Clostridia bacterium]|nr:DUF4143 domain-containing protein [Clostridia bacterium]